MVAFSTSIIDKLYTKAYNVPTTRHYTLNFKHCLYVFIPIYANEEYSVREDLFEAILGAIAIDSNWNLDALQSAVEIMLEPDSFLMEGNEDNYVAHIQEWTLQKTNNIPFFHFEEGGYQSTWYFLFDGISQQPKSLGDQEIHKTKFHCLLKISDELPVFRGFGQSKPEARKNVCKLAYDYLVKKGLWLCIRDEIKNPNKNDAINQLEILARRNYFSIPIYTFKEQHDSNGNPIWNCKCQIAEEHLSFSATSSSKKDSKKTAAFKMLRHVLK